MDPAKFISEISAKDFDRDLYAQLTISNELLRDETILQMSTNPDIMVYYHCYYIASRASKERPDLFYKYWDDIVPLLDHENSYHRDFALTIIANLTQIDRDNRFSEIYEAYFQHFQDEKFMTAQCCVQNSLVVIKNKPELSDKIVSKLLDLDNLCAYPERQLELLKCDALEVLEGVYDDLQDKQNVQEFIKSGVYSISPKMRRKAKELVDRYDL
jgi:hypothetical protein